MELDRITLVLGLDGQHMEELRWTWPTWMHFKPELRAMPLVVFYDPAEINPADAQFLNDHPDWRGVPWRWNRGAGQRENMLTGWLHVPAREVRTPWYLKLDTDVIAVGSGQWIKPEWFEPNGRGEAPVFVGASWDYSKPSHVLRSLDDWADKVGSLAEYPRLDVPFVESEDRVTHPRVISWILFGRTDWTQEAAGWLGRTGRMPVSSHDTYLSYCATRQRKYFLREPMIRYRWRHRPGWNVNEVLRVHGLKPASLWINDT